jgi:hypothetical protein
MSAYERDQWERLQAYWSRRANPRGTPKWLTDGARSVASASGRAAKGAATAVGKAVPDTVKEAAGKVSVPDGVKDAAGRAGGVVLDQALRPAASAAAHILELANDWVIELQDPQAVLATARRRGLKVESLADLREVHLRDCDRLLTRETLKWRTAGALEGAGMGALALVPVAGLPISIGADLLVMDLLCASIATRIAYSYGFDPKDPAEKELIDAMVSTALAKQLAKAGPMKDTALAHKAFAGRRNWSAKLRKDHRIGAELEKLMSRWYSGAHVPVQHVSKALGVLAILVGAGTNSQTLARVADHSRKYCQTRWLCERYALPLPPALRTLEPFAAEDADGADGDGPGPDGSLKDRGPTAR